MKNVSCISDGCVISRTSGLIIIIQYIFVLDTMNYENEKEDLKNATD